MSRAISRLGPQSQDELAHAVGEGQAPDDPEYFSGRVDRRRQEVDIKPKVGLVIPLSIVVATPRRYGEWYVEAMTSQVTDQSGFTVMIGSCTATPINRLEDPQ